jgi:NRPS condensation-like uncharacterized protein
VTGIPDRFAATGTDSAVSITRAVTLHRIGLSLAFYGRLDPDLLAKAVRMSLDAEPILGCSLETDRFKPCWVRIRDLEATRPFSIEQTDHPDLAMLAFQAEEIDDAGPQIAVRILRTEAADVLAIKTSHVVADGQAAKQFAYLLADLYTHLAADASYAPVPNLASRPTGRDVWDNLTREQRRHARKAKSWANPTWDVPFKGDGRSGGGLTYRTISIAPEQFAALKAHGKRLGATVNDVLLTAVFRACVQEFDPPVGVPLSLMCTADLRRYLPDAARLPIANISISGSLDLDRIEGERFDQTLMRVRQRMDAWAVACHGAGVAASTEKLAGLGYRATKALLGAAFRAAGSSHRTYPWFTNVGIIDDSRLSFGGLVPVAGHVFGPAAFGASIVPLISTYRDTLTICMGFCADDCDSEVVQRVLDATLAELDMGGCLTRSA